MDIQEEKQMKHCNIECMVEIEGLMVASVDALITLQLLVCVMDFFF